MHVGDDDGITVNVHGIPPRTGQRQRLTVIGIRDIGPLNRIRGYLEALLYYCGAASGTVGGESQGGERRGCVSTLREDVRSGQCAGGRRLRKGQAGSSDRQECEFSQRSRDTYSHGD